MNRTDLICENSHIKPVPCGDSVREYEIMGTKCVETRAADRPGRDGIAAGRYFTIFGGAEQCEEALYRVLRELLPESGSAMVAGLGNESIAADSLGAKSLRHVPATAHLAGHSDFTELGLRKVYVLETGVTGRTGIESALKVQLLAKEVGADFIIAVDSLACASAKRLCATVQVTDTGIQPGAGVGNSRKALTGKTAGRPVYAIGVPTVIDFDGEGETLMVTPRNIDRLTDGYGKVIGKAISRALNPCMSYEELSALIV